MNRTTLICFLLLLTVNLIIYIQAEDECIFPSLSNDPKILETNYGKIKGLCNKISIVDPDEPNKVGYAMTWYSVPFAKPPVNELRFRKPVEPEVWNDVKDGTVKSNICMQTLMGTSSLTLSEDCLYLNIFAPASLFNSTNSNEKLPIYFYIHGGRFEMGSGLDDDYDSKVLVSLTNVIVVTINYRLGPFGFLYFNDSDLSGNHGFLDQHVALKWVYENADHFRGDKNRITIGGFSAGSFSASYHLIYKPSWPYFRNMIMESGVLLYSVMEFMPLDEATRRAKEIFSMIGCGNDESASLSHSEILKCTENVDSSTFFNTANKFYKEILLGGDEYRSELTPLIRLVQNGEDFDYSIKEAFESDKLKRANILIGYTANEGGLHVGFSGFFNLFNPNTNYFMNKTQFRWYLDKYFYYFPTYPTIANSSFIDEVQNEYTKNPVESDSTNYLPALIQIISEEIFICPMIDLSRIYSKKSEVFSFSFNQYHSGMFPEALGVVHGGQVVFVFAKALQSDLASQFTDAERRFTKKVIKYWTNFMKYNNPNINDPTDKNYNTYWPTFKTELTLNILNPDTRYFNNYMTFKTNLVAPTNNLSFRHCNFWKNYNTYPNYS